MLIEIYNAKTSKWVKLIDASDGTEPLTKSTKSINQNCFYMYPLIDINNPIMKIDVENYWKDKPVRFAYLNNCVGCFHRTPVLLKHMSNKSPNQFDWFVKQEEHSGNYNNAQFKTGMTYRQIKNGLEQLQLFDDDFSECDSGYCGL